MSARRILCCTRPLALVVLAALACSDGTGPGTRVPARVRASTERAWVGLGDTTRLAAAVYDARDRAILGSTPRWRSLDPLKARVEAGSGLVTGVDTGTARIVASVASVEDTVLLTITRRVVSLTLQFAPDSIFPVGGYTARAVARDSRGEVIPDAVLLWTSSDSAVLKVSTAGAIGGHQEGAATLRVASGAVSAQKTVRTVPYRFGFGGRRPSMLTMGSTHGCMIDTEARAYCWGLNRNGSLGNGTTTPTPSGSSGFAEVTGGHRYAAIEARDFSTCAITTAQRLLCWGRNGAASGTGTGTPTGMIDSVPVQAISVGMHNQSCAIGTDGVTRCWGHNDGYQLGRGPLASYDPNILPVAGTQRYKGSIALGGFNGCALGVDDTTWCWGDMNTLPAGEDLRDRPIRVPGAPAFVQLEAFGSSGSCGRTAAGEVWCWGANWEDRLGPGAPDRVEAPARVTGLPPVVYLDTGGDHACGLTADGAIWCWGWRGAYGEAWRTTPLTQPARFGGTRRFRLLATSANGVCGVTIDDVAVCAGFSIVGTGL